MNTSIEIKRLKRNDVVLFEKLVTLFQYVFEMGKTDKTMKKYLQKMLDNPGFMAYIAQQGDNVIGGLTAFELPMYYSELSEVFIYDIAIHPEFQRKGIGKKLISALKKYCRKKGIQYIFVPANEEDAHALAFYTSTGGKPEKVVHFNYNAN